MRKVKTKINKQEREFLFSVSGFTSALERELSTRKPTKETVSLDQVTSMPTYSFAIIALKNNAPEQVIKVMQIMKKRYSRSKNFTSESMGFLESIEGKAYGYIALEVKNLEAQEKFYKLAIKCFESARSRGYHEALLDLADLQKRMSMPRVGEDTVYRLKDKSDEKYTGVGEMYYDFGMLVESASRVLEGKRALISDINAFNFSKESYYKGSKVSINSLMYYGLALIISGDKQKGLEIIKNSFDKFKESNKNYESILFKTDANKFKENIQIIEKKILKYNIR